MLYLEIDLINVCLMHVTTLCVHCVLLLLLLCRFHSLAGFQYSVISFLDKLNVS